MNKPALVFLFMLAIIKTNGQSDNIRLPDPVSGAGTSSPTVSINHKDPDNWIAGVRNHIVFTKDAGKKWSASRLLPKLHNYGDPVLISNGKSSFLLLSSAGLGIDSVRDRIASRTTSDGGATWEEEYYVGIHPSFGQARPRAGIEKGTVYIAWTEFEHDTPKDSACTANVLFSVTSNEGKKWADPIRINTVTGDCTDRARSMQAMAPVISAEGKLFMLWSNKNALFMDRSYNDGKTWLTNDLPINNARALTLTDIPGVEPNVYSPTFAVDRSMSYFRGSLYLVWSDQKNGKDDSDIWFMRSTNRGDFWSNPQRVNQDSSHRHQFLPSMVVDEVTGVIYLAWYDRREYEDGQTDVYLAFSVDGGTSFGETKLSGTPFRSGDGSPLTGPVALDAYKGVIVTVWAHTEGGQSILLSAPLKQTDLIKKDEMPRMQAVRR